MEWIAEIMGGTWFWTALWFVILTVLIQEEIINDDKNEEGFATFLAFIFFAPIALIMFTFTFFSQNTTNNIIGQHFWTAVSVYVSGFISYLGLKWALPRSILIAEIESNLDIED